MNKESKKRASRALIISWNPIPVEDKSTHISATGMRSYKLALGLLNNGIKKVDVAVKNYDAAMGRSADKRIEIHKWDSSQQLVKLANTYQAVIINSNLEDTTPYLLRNINRSVTKVVDAFIPLYFEEAMREDLDTEALKYHITRLAFLHGSLQMADYILVANKNQKLMYLGAAGAVNLLNSSNFEEYADNFVMNYPGVINEKISPKSPYTRYKEVINGRKVVVWFGSIYKWYDISTLLEAYRADRRLSQNTILFIVGAKNPLFKSESVEVKEGDSVVFIPWVNYEDRLGWLKYADIGVSLNRMTFENTFSYRNRLIDYVEAGLPIITNGEDPLGEEIIAAGGGVKVEDNIAEIILSTVESKKNETLRLGVSELKSRLDNTKNSKRLAELIFTHPKPREVLNEDYLTTPNSDLRSVKELLYALRWDNPKARPITALDDVMQFLSTKEVTKAAYHRLVRSASARIKKGNQL